MRTLARVQPGAVNSRALPENEMPAYARCLLVSFVTASFARGTECSSFEEAMCAFAQC